MVGGNVVATRGLSSARLAILPYHDALETPGSFGRFQEMPKAHNFWRTPVPGKCSQSDDKDLAHFLDGRRLPGCLPAGVNHFGLIQQCHHADLETR
jgi:hypothetical protein